MTAQIQGATPLWIAARTLLNERGDDLFRCWAKVLRTFEPEDIHDLRVASRRLREGLALFAPCYARKDIKSLDKKIKKVTLLLGGMRNTDEAIIFFTALVDELETRCKDVLGPFLALLNKERKRESRRLESGLQKMAVEDLKDFFQRTTNSLSLFTPLANGADLFAPLSGFARDSISSRLSAIRDFLPQARDKENIEAQHRLRIMVKHFRYRMEILSFLIGTRYQQFHAAIKGYQDVLGKMHDLDVFSEMVNKAEFSPECEKPILAAIRARRDGFYRGFSTMLTSMPLERIGEQVRDEL